MNSLAFSLATEVRRLHLPHSWMNSLNRTQSGHPFFAASMTRSFNRVHVRWVGVRNGVGVDDMDARRLSLRKFSPFNTALRCMRNAESLCSGGVSEIDGGDGVPVS